MNLVEQGLDPCPVACSILPMCLLTVLYLAVSILFYFSKEEPKLPPKKFPGLVPRIKMVQSNRIAYRRLFIGQEPYRPPGRSPVS